MAQNVNINAGGSYQDPKKQGSGFTNLSRVLQANRDNRLGSTISQGLQSGAQGVKNQLGQQVGQFQQASNAAQLGNPQELAQKQAALQRISAGEGGVSENDISLFQKLRGGNYTGPTGLDQSKVAGLANRASNLEGIGKGLGAGGDKTAALRAFISQNPGYSSGEQKLDTLLLGAPEQKSQLASGRRAGVGLQKEVGKEASVAQQIGELRRKEAANVGRETRGELGLTDEGNVNLTGKGLVPELYENIKKQSEQYKTDYDKFLERFNTANMNQTGGILTADDYAKLGITPGQEGYQTFGVDLMNPAYYSQGMAPTLSGSANAQQRAQMDALSKLSGISPSGLIDPSSQIYDPNKPINFDSGKFQQEVAGKKAAYETALQNAKVLAPTHGLSTPASEVSLTERLNQFQTALQNTPQSQLDYQGYGDYLRANINELLGKQNAIKEQYGYNKKI